MIGRRKRYLVEFKVKVARGALQSAAGDVAAGRANVVDQLL